MLALALGVTGLLAGLALAAVLGRRGYRYDDEQDLPARPIRWVAPVVAVAAALLGVGLGHDLAVAYRGSAEVVTLAVTYGAALLWMAGLAVIDLDVRRLPDRWTLPAYPVVAAGLAACAAAAGAWEAWPTALACGAVSGAAYLVLALLNPAGLGLGDVKLAGTLGMLAGYLSWQSAFAAFLLAFLLGAVAGVVVALRTGEGRKATFPFGPAMLGGAVVAILLAV